MAQLKDTIIYGDLVVTGTVTGLSAGASSDADTLDGLHASSFARSDVETNFAYNNLTNVTLKNWCEAKQNLGSISGAVTISTLNGNVIVATISAATTFTFTSPITTDISLGFTMVLTNGGSFITWPSSVKWASGIVPTLTTTGIDIVSFTTINDGTTWFGMISGKGFE